MPVIFIPGLDLPVLPSDNGPVYLCKIDVADGFYRVDLEAATAPTLAVILPQKEAEPPVVAIPLSLPMGWVEFPHTSVPLPKQSQTWRTATSTSSSPHIGWIRWPIPRRLLSLWRNKPQSTFCRQSLNQPTRHASLQPKLGHDQSWPTWMYMLMIFWLYVKATSASAPSYAEPSFMPLIKSSLPLILIFIPSTTNPRPSRKC
jgi:hypothetical protein